jgi:hypothetical protein
MGWRRLPLRRRDTLPKAGLRPPADSLRRIFSGLTAWTDTANIEKDSAMEFALQPPW